MRYSIRTFPLGVLACLSMSAHGASHSLQIRGLGEVSVEGIRSLPAGLDAPASDVLSMVLDSGRSDIADVTAKLDVLAERARLYSQDHRLPDRVLHERVDLAALKARIESPDATPKDRLMIAVAMEAFMVALGPVLSMPENAELLKKFKEASATAARFLPEDMRARWEATDKAVMVRSFMAAGGGSRAAEKPADVLAFAPAAGAAPESARLKASETGRPLASIAGLEPMEKLKAAHPEAALELARVAAVLGIAPAHYVWLDGAGDEARSGLFHPDVLVVLGPGFHNRLAFHAQGPILAWNAVIDADLASDGVLAVVGGKIGKADLRGKKVVTSGVEMESATVNGRAAVRPPDMGFVNAKIKAVKDGQK